LDQSSKNRLCFSPLPLAAAASCEKHRDHPMVAIVTEAWALAGCGAASKAAPQEAPVQHPPPPAVAKSEKTASSFRGASIIRCQDRREAVVVGRRSGLVSCVLAASFSPLAADRPARAAVLEEDDDIELLERVKEDRKKRLQRQGVISSSGTETGQLYLLVLSFFLCFLKKENAVKNCNNSDRVD
jgi:hypothetical protein